MRGHVCGLGQRTSVLAAMLVKAAGLQMQLVYLEQSTVCSKPRALQHGFLFSHVLLLVDSQNLFQALGV